MRKKIAPEGLKSYVPFVFPCTDGEVRVGLEDECGIETWDYWENDKMQVVNALYQTGYSLTGNSFYIPTLLCGNATYNFHPNENRTSPSLDFYPFFYDGDTTKANFGFAVSSNNSGIYNVNSSDDYEFEAFICFYRTSGIKQIVLNSMPAIAFGENEFKIILEHEDNNEKIITDLLLGFSAEREETNGGYWTSGGSTRHYARARLLSDTWNINAKKIQDITVTYEDIYSVIGEDGLSDGERKLSTVWYEYPDDNYSIHILLRITGNIATVFIDNKEALRATLPANVELHPSKLKVGGFLGNISNYAFWHKAGTGTPEIPTAVYPSTLNINELGGAGTGADGDIIANSISNFNCCGLISSVIDARTLEVSSWYGGKSGVSPTAPTKGCELMIHVAKPRKDEDGEWPYVGMYAFRKIMRLKNNQIILNRGIREETDGFTLSQELIETYYVQAIIVPNYNTFTLNNNNTLSPVIWQSKKCGGIIVLRTAGDCTINGKICTHKWNSNNTTAYYGNGRLYDNHTMSHNTLLNRFLCSRGGGIIIVCGGKLTLSSTCRLGYTDGMSTGHGYAGHGGGSKSNVCNGYSPDSGKGRTQPGKDGLQNNNPGGACLIIIANTAVIDDQAIQTGGYGASTYGAGGGFCYMAIGEFLNE